MAELPYREVIELHGHIIDSYILPAIMDEVMDRGGEFEVLAIQVGRRKDEPSYARIAIGAPTQEVLDILLDRAQRLGATTIDGLQVQLAPAPADGVFPDGFYSTTNLETQIRLDGQWIPVQYPEMDCGIVVDVEARTAMTVPLNEVKAGQLVVIGHEGVRVTPLERPRRQPQSFGFMGSAVSSEKPKAILIREIAAKMQEVRRRAGRTVIVAGPALVHTGARAHLVRLIEEGYVQALFAGNGLATHDIESALFGTSLGISITEGVPLEGGHEHHLRAINRIRAAGGIAAAVEQGILTSGIMYACVKHGVKVVLAGSIRDDGPLPEVLTDVLAAQAAMRQVIREGIDLVMILSSMLHGIAVGNLLPATVTTVCVDISPAAVTKLNDRGSFQTVGLVMDVAGFLRELCQDLAL